MAGIVKNVSKTKQLHTATYRKRKAMNDMLYALTTESINFTNNSFGTEVKDRFAVGTMVEIDQYEMESNPDFFHVSIEGTDGRIWAYVSIDQVACA